MPRVDWRLVRDDDFRVPASRPLTDLTAELTELLGNPDPHLRNDLALPVLSNWIGRGVYDDLLRGLGDGIATGLLTGLGENGTDTVFRRSYCALVLGDIIDRDTDRLLVPPAKVLEWGDRLATWYLAERDLRAYVPMRGWAHAVAHGADALGALARSPHCGAGELVVLLDVICERVIAPVDRVWTSGEPDRLAHSTLEVLRRGLVPQELLEPWLRPIGEQARKRPPRVGGDVYRLRGNAASYLRALYLQLALGPEPPPGRADLLLLLVDHLRAAHPAFLGPQHRDQPSATGTGTA